MSQRYPSVDSGAIAPADAPSSVLPHRAGSWSLACSPRRGLYAVRLAPPFRVELWPEGGRLLWRVYEYDPAGDRVVAAGDQAVTPEGLRAVLRQTAATLRQLARGGRGGAR